jgi:FlaA1/EpsC-like NDP-sugar epimerase
MLLKARFRSHRWTRAASIVVRRVLSLVLDFAVFPAAALLSFTLRFDAAIPVSYSHAVKVSTCVWAITGVAAFLLAGVHRGSRRYTSIFDAARILAANTAGSIIGGLILFFTFPRLALPRSVYVLEWLISSSILLGGRLLCRVILTARKTKLRREDCTRILIYGAGSAGVALLAEFRQNGSLMGDVVGFVDDDPSKAKLLLGGKPILGTGEDLVRLVPKLAIQRVLIAIPSAAGSEMTRILKLVSDANVEFKAVPGLGDLVQGAELGRQIRDVAVEDLLGRRPIELDLRAIRARISGKVVLVSGAAGSIGSELCRQLAHFEPRSVIGFDQAETPLFHLQREMARLFPEVDFYPEIGSVNDRESIQRVIAQYRPVVVYHAAAYKHVPLMEMHAFAAIETNVFGTWNVARAAVRGGVEDFVMISTDKAVRPTSVMGASKRVAELMIRAMQKGQGTKFVAVRFGNVLGSNGSVVPIFKEQIAAGGPVTVTHPEITRYFMTIHEAVQLVLQAYTLGRGGEVFVLEMGDPVKIVELAKNLILLSGFRPEQDIEIRYTGLRPGEKLHEELHLMEECMLATSHPKIRIYEGNHQLDELQLEEVLRLLKQIIESRDIARLVLFLKEIIPEYNPGAQMLEAALLRRLPVGENSLELMPYNPRPAASRTAISLAVGAFDNA